MGAKDKAQHDAPGLQKEHEIFNAQTGETRTVTQQEWMDNGQQLRAEGFDRADDDGMPTESGEPVDGGAGDVDTGVAGTETAPAD